MILLLNNLSIYDMQVCLIFYVTADLNLTIDVWKLLLFSGFFYRIDIFYHWN